MTEKRLILASRVISSIISPFYLPVFGMIVLFMFTYLGMLDTWIKLRVLFIVYIFTVAIPTYLIRLYHYYHGWTPIQIGSKERRMVPYVIAIVCYFICYYILNLLHMPHFIGTVIVAALVLQVVCALVNLRWKVSTHSVLVPFHFQSHMVAFFLVLHGGIGGHESHDTPPAHSYRGVYGFPHWYSGGFPRSDVLQKYSIEYNFNEIEIYNL